MPIVEVSPDLCGDTDYRRLVPGSRVLYRGTLWKVVGLYFLHGPHSPEAGLTAVTGVGRRVKYLILASLDMAAESLQFLGVTSSQ
jgi:hypothetical protein